MRTTPLLLIPLLLAGCVKQSATFYVDQERERAITVRAEQEYFWEEATSLALVVSNMPDCQRRFEIGKMPVADLVVELFSVGDAVYTVRAGTEVWQVEAQNCTQMAAPKPEEMGAPVAVFRIGEGEKLDLEVLKPAAEAPAPAPAADAAAAVEAPAAQ